MEYGNKNQHVNLIVKNLDMTIGDQELRNQFSKFGNIVSSKVMLDQGRSKGFGFVCFSSRGEALKAIEEMNGRVIRSKKLSVSVAQTKEERKAFLTSQYLERRTNYASQNQMGTFMQPRSTAVNYFVQNTPHPPLLYYAIPLGFKGSSDAYDTGIYRSDSLETPSSIPRETTCGCFACASPSGIEWYDVANQAIVAGDQAFNYNYVTNMQVPTSSTYMVPVYALHVEGCESLTAAQLSAAPPQHQKQMLGERLYKLIYKMYPDIAGQITEMLLVLDNYILILMLLHSELLKAKVEEVVAVLQMH